MVLTINWFFFFFFFSMILFSMNFKHVLSSLIMMEFIVMSMSMIILVMMMFFCSEIFVLFYLVFSVMESVLGLSLIINLNRFHGKDYFFSMDLGMK